MMSGEDTIRTGVRKEVKVRKGIPLNGGPQAFDLRILCRKKGIHGLTLNLEHATSDTRAFQGIFKILPLPLFSYWISSLRRNLSLQPCLIRRSGLRIIITRQWLSLKGSPSNPSFHNATSNSPSQRTWCKVRSGQVWHVLKESELTQDPAGEVKGRGSQAHDMHAWVSLCSNDRAKISPPFTPPLYVARMRIFLNIL